VTTDRSTLAWDVFGDASRRQIMAELADEPRAVGELADRLPISRPAVSQHLRVLKDAGVVTDDVRGTRRVYRVDPVALGALKDQLDTFWQRTLAGFAEVAKAADTPETAKTDRRRRRDR
jgi:DNA-binding transcriptional ArsR family regulator